jgi:hypothetical protein
MPVVARLSKARRLKAQSSKIQSSRQTGKIQTDMLRNQFKFWDLSFDSLNAAAL